MGDDREPHDTVRDVEGRAPSAGHEARAKGPPRAHRCPTCKQAFSGGARFCPYDGDVLADAPDWDPAGDPLIGRVIDDRYEVLRVLGEGGMGTVYHVRHTSLERPFALKVLRRDIAQEPEYLARFLQEARAAAAIGHPNIVAVTDFGEVALEEGRGRTARAPYFVMEFLKGISLSDLLGDEKVLEPKRVARIVSQCASALAAAHATGVVHRDMKPDNVLLVRSSAGEPDFVKLLDFGVAKIAGAGRLTRQGIVFGTPHYMSPEQASGGAIDHRADVYALGVILYECLCGHVPFEADTYMGVLTKHTFAEPEPVERAAPEAEGLGALAPIVMRCLAKDPAHRYADMDELAAALDQAAAAPPRPLPAVRRERERGRERPNGGLRLRAPAPIPPLQPAPVANEPDEPVDLPLSRPTNGKALLFAAAAALGTLALLLVLRAWPGEADTPDAGDRQPGPRAPAGDGVAQGEVAPERPQPSGAATRAAELATGAPIPAAAPATAAAAPAAGASSSAAGASAVAPASVAESPAAASAAHVGTSVPARTGGPSFPPAGSASGQGLSARGEVVDPWARK